MKRMLLTNCPNCGGELTSEGFCNYCKTKIRYANEIEISNDSMFSMPGAVEILIKVKRGNEIVLVPFRGCLEMIEEHFDTVCAMPLYNNYNQVYYSQNRNKVDLKFSGYFMRNEVKKIK